MADVASLDVHNCNELIEQRLDEHLAGLERFLNADILTFMARIRWGADDAVRDVVEERTPRRDKLVVILQTTGGASLRSSNGL